MQGKSVTKRDHLSGTREARACGPRELERERSVLGARPAVKARPHQSQRDDPSNLLASLKLKERCFFVQELHPRQDFQTMKAMVPATSKAH
jgi:hypothetical protein